MALRLLYLMFCQVMGVACAAGAEFGRKGR